MTVESAIAALLTVVIQEVLKEDAPQERRG